MGLSKSILGKDIYDLTISDLSSFFSAEQEETSVLEFKSGGVEIDEIYREVCAFLNTEGGILIIGAPKENRVTVNKIDKKICQGELMPTFKIKSEDILLRKIASNISPAPYNIKVKPLDYMDGKIYVIEVPQSLTPPHQVNQEGKYYIRLEKEAKAAPHGVVEALFFKRQKPDLDLMISVVRKLDKEGIFIEFRFQNESNITAENIGYLFEIYDVTEIVEQKGFSPKLEVEQNSIKHYDNLKEAIIVKGIFIRRDFSIRPTGNFLFIKCTYFCRDIQAETKAVIMDLNGNFKSYKGFNTKKSNNELTVQQLYDEFKELNTVSETLKLD